MDENLDHYNGFCDFQLKNKKAFPIKEVAEKLTISRASFFNYKKEPTLWNIQTIFELSDIYDVDPMFITKLIFKDMQKKGTSK